MQLLFTYQIYVHSFQVVNKHDGSLLSMKFQGNGSKSASAKTTVFICRKHVGFFFQDDYKLNKANKEREQLVSACKM